MSDRDVFAKHVLVSIHKDLNFLKEQNYLTPQKYNDILNQLPVIGQPNQARDVPSFPSSPYGNSQPSPVASAPPPMYESSNALATVEALYDFRGENPSADLTFRKGDIIQVTEYVNNDWWRGTLRGQTGMFPSNYVQKMTSAPPPPPPSQTASPPPPPPPAGGMSPPPPSGRGNNYAYPPPPSSGGSGYAYPPPPPAASSGYNNYPPPPPATYSAPPVQPPPSYPVPPSQPVQSYAPPPAQPAPAAAPAAAEPQESKVAGFGKQLAGNVVNAATWGFGGTIGSEVAHSLF
ncbi:hypothetical protein DFQ28_009461 [Apophysomyces sp. BC1034]|nr:hypothetical protein DFQ30_010944 [Apophysomyces sp. BC1015]KAG0172994.1 hypothetical protein DFQ29_008143 [Apophysomyces sp. BC1021]KAG0185377.1 hypothetical protein DFQ28_009461 [Apophysomyces sp. BC1034]